jgi:hypothetical protein
VTVSSLLQRFTASGDKSKSSRTEPSLRLVASARLIFRNQVAPEGLKPTDWAGFVEGLVEEESPFSLEQTCWGFVADRKSKPVRILYYEAFRNRLFKSDKEEQTAAVLPGVAALFGKSKEGPVWRFLMEDECLTVARFPSGSFYPDRVVATFDPEIQTDATQCWLARKALRTKAGFAPGENEDPALYRCTGMRWVRGRWHLIRERQRTSRSPWEHTSPVVLHPGKLGIHADLRDTAVLLGKRKAGLHNRIFAGSLKVAAVLVVLLLLWQWQLGRETARLTELNDRLTLRQPVIKAIESKEATVQATRDALSGTFEPLDWLLVLNGPRPETMALHTVAMGLNRTVLASGSAPNVTLINTYAEALRATGQFDDVQVANINAGRENVEFQLRLKTARLNPSRLPETRADSPPPAPDSPAPVPEDNAETPNNGESS